MTRLIVLFNLKPGIDAARYEAWARAVDLPTVHGLKSIHGFDIFRSVSVLGSPTVPPYQYIEIIDINDMTQFGEDVATDTMQRVAAEFGKLADATFILTEHLK